jgi:hypothetical protein
MHAQQPYPGALDSIQNYFDPNFWDIFNTTKTSLLPKEFAFEASMSRSEEVQDLNT